MVRFYDPTTGTFLTRDPANAVTRSAYGYTYGNPLNATDPSGLYCLTGVKGHRDDGSEICNGAAEVVDNVTDVAPGGIGATKPLLEWEWNHPSEHADVLGGIGNIAGGVEIGALLVPGGQPVAVVAGIVGATASAGEMVQGIRCDDHKHIVAGGVGVVTFGLGAGASKIAAELGGGKIAELIISFYEKFFAYEAPTLVQN